MRTTFPFDTWGMHGANDAENVAPSLSARAADDTVLIKIAQSAAPGARERPIKLSTADDGNEVERTIPNDDGFIANSSNFALFKSAGTPMIRGHAAEGDRVWHTAFSPFSGAPSIPRKNMCNFSNNRASDADKAE